MEVGQTVPELGDNISSFEASQLISELIGKSPKNGTNGAQNKQVINEPRLGMAMKESFRLWTRLGRNIWREHRKPFILDVIDTYNLFTEIAAKVQESTVGRESG